MTHLPTDETFDLLLAYFVGPERKLLAGIRGRSRERRTRHAVTIQAAPRESGDQSPSAIQTLLTSLLKEFIGRAVVPALLERLLKSQGRADVTPVQRVKCEPSA